MKLIYKVWFESGGARAFGEGPYRLLKGVELTGSLKESAAGLSMAYSQARRLIQCCERTLGFPLTLRKIGGATGGSSVVTDEAVKLMREYEFVRTVMEDVMGKAYKKHFGESIKIEFYTAPKRRRTKR
ncbi:MAG: hypothetical protein A4E58_03096 [Syntrophorhabdus sp. PtaB.Bin006]|nr:MAG: hypothetical protein A4E58_03096 [Syntrophorhabdus sp. PtaB.Bin006]